MTEEADYRCKREISFTLNQGSYETGYTFLSAPVPLLQEGAGLSGGTAAAGTLRPHRNQDDRRTGRTEVADRYDYYYVPTFYVGDKKVHEGGIMPDEVEAVLRMALDER